MRNRGNSIRRLTGVAVIGVAAVTAAGVAVAAADPDTLARTTLEQRIVPNSDPDFKELALGPGEPSYTVREEGVGTAQPERAGRRESLIYLGQLSDFQLADEESPSRVEFIDAGPASAAWRPMEALNPHVDDAMIRQLNALAAASPVADADGAFRPMDLTLTTGDNADSQQLNETQWVLSLLEGGTLDPGSGVDPAGSANPLCTAVAPLIADAASPQNYTGVQDYDDYNEGPAPQFYDPDSPASAWSAWPEYDGLMDAAQEPFEAAGLDVPSYLVIGNHDGLVQGNQSADAAIEDVATGCIKVMAPVTTDPDSLSQALAALSPANLLNLLASDPTKLGFVPPDPRRQYVSTEQYRDIFLSGSQADGHGFGLTDPDELTDSGGSAGYYAWSPEPGLRIIGLNTVSEAGVTGPSADGNIDHPQFQWLEQQLQDATAADELVVIFSHHAIPSLTSPAPDEIAGPCTGPDEHGHGDNPGCDVDPRDSSPIHLGGDLEELLFQYPHAVAWVAGHSHVNSINAHPNPSGGGFWDMRVAAEADWPQQTRLIELFDNDDGTLSIFGTIVDHASDAAAAASGAEVGDMTPSELASIGRTLAANDPQGGVGTGEGQLDDRNVELLVADPREPGPPPTACDPLGTIRGTTGDDDLAGTPASDRIKGRAGNDRIKGRAGDDCVGGSRGRDKVNGEEDDDRVRGGRGGDRVKGGAGSDSVKGGRGNDIVVGGPGLDDIGGGRGDDRLRAADGVAEQVRCGPGSDSVIADPEDTVKGCERVKRR